jgi:hypothetical protein
VQLCRPNVCLFYVYSREAPITQQFRTHFKILGARRAAWSKSSTENLQIFYATVQNLDTLSTWRPGFVHPWFREGCKSLFFKNIGSQNVAAYFGNFGFMGNKHCEWLWNKNFTLIYYFCLLKFWICVEKAVVMTCLFNDAAIVWSYMGLRTGTFRPSESAPARCTPCFSIFLHFFLNFPSNYFIFSSLQIDNRFCFNKQLTFVTQSEAFPAPICDSVGIWRRCSKFWSNTASIEVVTWSWIILYFDQQMHNYFAHARAHTHTHTHTHIYMYIQGGPKIGIQYIVNVYLFLAHSVYIHTNQEFLYCKKQKLNELEQDPLRMCKKKWQLQSYWP